MVLRWFLDGTRVAQLALDNQVSGSTAYLHDAIVVLAAAAPSLHGALPAARTAGYSHVLIIDDSALVAGGLCVLGVCPPLILLMAAALAATDETELQRAGSRRR
jgi:hypothetical protein